MKRFYKNTLISGAFSKALRVLALLCVLLGVSSSAMADAGFWTDNAWDFYWWTGSENKWNGESTSTNWNGGYSTGYTVEVDLGTISGAPYLKGFRTRVWKNDGSDITAVTVTYSGAISGNIGLSWEANRDNSNDQCWATQNINNGDGIAFPTTSGTHTINLTFTTSGTVKSFNATIKYTIAGETTHTYAIAGSFNDWNATSHSCTIPSTENCEASFDLAKGNYTFKLLKDDDWYGNSGTIENETGDGGWSFETSNIDNCTLNISEAGTYKFTFGENLGNGYRVVVTKTAAGGGSGGSGADDGYKPGDSDGNLDFVLDTKTNNFGGWIEGDVFAKFYENEDFKTGKVLEVQLTKCASDYRILYYSSSSFNLSDWKSVYVYTSQNKNDAKALLNGKNCMQITAWGKMSENANLTTCTMTTFTGDCDTGGSGSDDGGGSGSDDDDNESVNCDRIEIYCRYLDSNDHNMKLHIWNNGGSKYNEFPGNTGTTVDVKGVTYAMWSFDTSNKNICVQFVANDNENCKTESKCGLSSKNKYYFELPNSWCGKSYDPVKTEQIICDGDVSDDMEDYESGTSVLVSYEPVQRGDNNWTLSGYLEASCANGEITDYGFFLCETDANGGCVPTSTEYSYKVQASSRTPLMKGDHFTGITANLGNAWYGYRAYVVADGQTILSPNTKYFNNKCSYELTGDTVYVTIDNSLVNNNECELKFKSFHDAWSELKKLPEICTASKITYGRSQDKITLLKPVVMKVVPTGNDYVGNEAVGLTGGDQRDIKAVFFRNINMEGGAPLIVRSSDKENNGAKASLRHVAIRRSKNITLDYLSITGTSEDVSYADNAIDIDNGQGDGNSEGFSQTDWNCVNFADIKDANIVIKNSNIISYGFTCIHLSAYDGVTFENNEIKAMYDFVEAAKISHPTKTNQANNTAGWGASAKIINSQNIKFVRNNFTGQHATSVLLQGTQKVLIYGNVFWHENAVKSSHNTVSIIRLMSYGSCKDDNPLQNIGIYYNTMFLKNNTVGDSYYNHFDFFRLGGNEQTDGTNYKPATIEFDYNNCYSYDEDVYGKNYDGSYEYKSDTKTKYLQGQNQNDWCGSFKYNNFWSVYEENLTPKPTISDFALGSDCGTGNTFTNVANLVCKTAPEEPGSLVIKGEDLNTGAFIQTDVSGLLTDEMQMIDRLGNPRPYDKNALEGKGTYTIGAYQQSTGATLNKIIWNGETSTEWDNRNNWYKPNGQLVTCVDILDENLEVVIPSPKSTLYPTPASGVKQYPTTPAGISSDAKFTGSSRSVYAGWNEEVSAGKGEVTPTQLAKTITMEYGAALVGVEELASGTRRYDEARTTLVTPRDKWILVGTVIQPWQDGDDHTKGVRDIVSNDYYMNHYPHVYMHQAEANGATISWKNSFADLTVPVPADEVYAINVADQYGQYKLTAKNYYTFMENDANMVDDGSRSKTISFKGRFKNEASLPDYGTLASGKTHLISNTYPANIDVAKLKSSFPGTVQVYNSKEGSFEVVTSGTILSQNGFGYSPSASRNLKLTQAVFTNDSTSLRSATIALPELRLVVTNTADPKSSNVLITVDELKEDKIDYAMDAPKMFNATDNKLPEVYVMRYNEKWGGIAVPNMEEPIALGVKTLRNNVSIKFSLRDVKGIGAAILEDRMEGKSYNLTLGEECIIEALPKGETEGRFFLNLSAVPEEDLPNDEEEGDDDITTEVEEELVSESGISIIGNSEGIVVSSSADIELLTIIVNDMSGKSASYRVSGQYAEIKLPVAQGVYTVNVIGDTATKTGKVILK